MQNYVVGKMGGGKTFFALTEIFSVVDKNSNKYLFEKRKKIRNKILSTNNKFIKKFYLLQYPKYIIDKNRKKNIITNIAGLKYKKLKEYAKDKKSDINFYQLKPEEFNDFCQLAHHYISEYRKLPANEEDENDKGEMKYSANKIRENHPEYQKFLDSIIIFDECGTSELWAESEHKRTGADLGRLSFILIHRHLNDELYFIVQDANLILKAYRGNSERFYVAQSSTYRKFTNNMRYFVYSSLADIKNDFVKPDMIKTIPIKKEYFEYYESGANESGANPFKKYIFYIFLIILIFISSVYYLFNSISEKTGNIKESKEITQQYSLNKKDNKQLKNNETDLLIKCNLYKESLYCKVNNDEDKYYLDIELNDLQTIIKEENFNIKFIKTSKQILFYTNLELIKNYFYKLENNYEENTHTTDFNIIK